jgi:hypothetical protein
MTGQQDQPVTVPARHQEFDGSESLRGAATATVISGVGDVFVVEYEPDRRIGWEPEAGRGHPNAAPGSSAPARRGQRWSYHLTPDGPDATVVTEIYDCSQAPEDERAGMDNGKVRIEGMTKTLERLDAICARQQTEPSPE